MRFAAVLAVCMSLICPTACLGLAYSTVGNEKLAAENYADWPRLIYAINDPARVLMNWCNGDEYLSYSGDAASLNRVLRKFAQTQAAELHVVLRPGPGQPVERQGAKVPVDWSIHVVGGIARAFVEQEKTETVSDYHPTFAEGQRDEKAAGRKNDERPPKTIAELIESFNGAETFWRQGDVARELIAYRDPSIIPKIENQLQETDRRRRCNAALVLAGLGDQRGLPILIGELNDKNPRPTDMRRSDGKPFPEGQIKADRYYAALLLGELKRKEAVPDLIEATTDRTISERVAISLGEIGDKRAIPALRQMIADFPDEKLWPGYGLAALGEQEGFDILGDTAVFDSRWTERRHAVEALGKLGDRRSLPALKKALLDDEVKVRESAKAALRALAE